MPIDLDIREHEVLPLIIEAERRGYRKGREEGRQEARQEGRQEGRREGRRQGELIILRRQIVKRFGTLPAWAGEKLAAMPPSELEALIERILDAQSLEELMA
jgi:flagellar biosynthesis/type III secretory pathway protein FliH